MVSALQKMSAMGWAAVWGSLALAALQHCSILRIRMRIEDQPRQLARLSTKGLAQYQYRRSLALEAKRNSHRKEHLGRNEQFDRQASGRIQDGSGFPQPWGHRPSVTYPGSEDSEWVELFVQRLGPEQSLSCDSPDLVAVVDR